MQSLKRLNAKQHKGQPSMIEIKTVIGYGSPDQGTSKTHGAPLEEENWQVTREYLKWENATFDITDDIYATYQERIIDRGTSKIQRVASNVSRI